MKCPRCNGKRCEPDNSGSLVWRACKMCHGTGIVPDNNENWFCSLSTEEKAEVIAQLSSYGGNVDAILDWLKGEHRQD